MGAVCIRVGDSIASSIRVRFLGLILDSKLSFGKHVDAVRERCFMVLNIFRFLNSIKIDFLLLFLHILRSGSALEL